MSISILTQEKIDFLYKTNPVMREKLSNLDAEAIREVGSLSQRGMDPDGVIVAYESGDQDTLKYLYEQAKRLVMLKELYKDLCFEYYKKTKSIPDEPTTIHKL